MISRNIFKNERIRTSVYFTTKLYIRNRARSKTVPIESNDQQFRAPIDRRLNFSPDIAPLAVRGNQQSLDITEKNLQQSLVHEENISQKSVAVPENISKQVYFKESSLDSIQEDFKEKSLALFNKYPEALLPSEKNKIELLQLQDRIKSSGKNELYSIFVENRQIFEVEHYLNTLVRLAELSKERNLPSDFENDSVIQCIFYDVWKKMPQMIVARILPFYKVFLDLKIDHNSLIFQSALQLIRHQINDLNAKEVIFLYELLKNTENCALKFALFKAIPRAVENIVDFKVPAYLNGKEMSQLLNICNVGKVKNVRKILKHMYFSTIPKILYSDNIENGNIPEISEKETTQSKNIPEISNDGNIPEYLESNLKNNSTFESLDFSSSPENSPSSDSEPVGVSSSLESNPISEPAGLNSSPENNPISEPAILGSSSNNNLISEPAILGSSSNNNLISEPVILGSSPEKNPISEPAILGSSSNNNLISEPAILGSSSNNNLISEPAILGSSSDNNLSFEPVNLNQKKDPEISSKNTEKLLCSILLNVLDLRYRNKSNLEQFQILRLVNKDQVFSQYENIGNENFDFFEVGQIGENFEKNPDKVFMKLNVVNEIITKLVDEISGRNFKFLRKEEIFAVLKRISKNYDKNFTMEIFDEFFEKLDEKIDKDSNWSEEEMEKLEQLKNSYTYFKKTELENR